MMNIASPPQLDFVNLARNLGTTLHFRPGDVVFREGDPAATMYVVLSGGVSVRSHGREIEVIGPGAGLGILSLIDGKPRSAEAVAVGDTELAVFEARRFRYMVEEVPHFVWFVMNEMAHRLRTTNAAL